MFNKKWLLLLAILICSCSRHVIRQSISEIDRPLFLPSGNWQTSFGAIIDRRMSTGGNGHMYKSLFDIDDKTTWSSILDLQWPSIHFGDNIEYYAPTILRWYLRKNIAVSDSIQKISGANIALVNGLNSFSYSQLEKLRLSTMHYVMMKGKIAATFWLESAPGFIFSFPANERIKYDFDVYLKMPITLGWQATEHLSAKGSVALLESYHYDAIDPKNEYEKAWERTTRIYDLDLQVPIELKYVFNYHWEISLDVNSIIDDDRNIYLESAVWSAFTW